MDIAYLHHNRGPHDCRDAANREEDVIWEHLYVKWFHSGQYNALLPAHTHRR